MAERPQGYTDIPEEDRKKAQVFFDYGTSAANTGNYEYAVEMYLQGLTIDPDSVDAHQTLWDIALKRKASGGKTLGFMEKMKLNRPTKDDKQNMLNSEKVLAYNPSDTDAMVGVFQNALRGGYFDTVMWMGPLLQQANADSPKPDVNKFIIIRDGYKSLKEWKRATDACHYAAMLRPDDMDLQNELKNLGAMDTMNKGNYGTAKSFRDSVRDSEGQTKRLIEDKDVRTMDQLAILIADAEQEWQVNPDDPGKIMKLVEILVKTEQPDYENRAIELLQGAFERTRQFRFRLNIGKIHFAQMNRMERSLRQAVQANPQDADARQQYAQYVQEKTTRELEEYQLWAENYPTDAGFRYQVSIRLYQLQRFDEAIPILQQVRQDPKLRTDATIILGRAFLDAGFADEASETLGAVIAEYIHKGDKKSIDMTYWYGRALEQKGDTQAAIKSYSQVAQWEFNYKDVQVRIKKLRSAPAST